MAASDPDHPDHHRGVLTVCPSYSARKLSSWLRLILTTQAITEEYYQPWSYVVSTGVVVF